MSPNTLAMRGMQAVPLTRTALPLASVLLVECTAASPSFISPWRYRDQQGSVGSAFAVEGRRILTNAHVVRDAVRLRVQRFGSAEKFPARIVAVSLECDLALIEIIDETVDPHTGRHLTSPPLGASSRSEVFWRDLPCLEWAESSVPELYDTVSVIGFPAGGQTICVTKGVVSRIDTQTYNRYSASALLIAQIDAAINPGNSGGPAIDDLGKVAGVAFLKRTSIDTDNVGYIIPALVAKNFLRNLEINGGRFGGLPELGFEYQSLDNLSLRRATGMREGLTGVLVVDVAPLGPLGMNDDFTDDEGEGDDEEYGEDGEDGDAHMSPVTDHKQRDQQLRERGASDDDFAPPAEGGNRSSSGGGGSGGGGGGVGENGGRPLGGVSPEEMAALRKPWLRVGDVVLKADNHAVANDGSVR